MHSNDLRKVVRDTKSFIETGDLDVETKRAKFLITDICKRLNKHYASSPRTAAAIIKYIEDHGYQLRKIQCVHTVKSVRKKEEIFETTSAKDLNHIRIICENLFSQIIGDD